MQEKEETVSGGFMGIIVIVKNRRAADLPSLVNMAIEYAYDRKHMSASRVRLMQDSIVAWSKKVPITEEEKYLVDRIGWFLNFAESDKFKKRLELFEKTGVKYQKFHRIPKYGPYA